MKHDIMKQLQGLDPKERVVIVFDSMGNLASKKEVDDAVEGKSVADMTRAKAFKSLFRMVTPYLNSLDIPMIVVNHTYKEMSLYPKDIVSGGTGTIKVMYKGMTYFVCCTGCRDAFLDDPEKYIREAAEKKKKK